MAGREFDLERHFQQNYYCQSTLCKDKQRIITKKRIEKRENVAEDTVCDRYYGHVSQKDYPFIYYFRLFTYQKVFFVKTDIFGLKMHIEVFESADGKKFLSQRPLVEIRNSTKTFLSATQRELK